MCRHTCSCAAPGWLAVLRAGIAACVPVSRLPRRPLCRAVLCVMLLPAGCASCIGAGCCFGCSALAGSPRRCVGGACDAGVCCDCIAGASCRGFSCDSSCDWGCDWGSDCDGCSEVAASAAGLAVLRVARRPAVTLRPRCLLAGVASDASAMTASSNVSAQGTVLITHSNAEVADGVAVSLPLYAWLRSDSEKCASTETAAVRCKSIGSIVKALSKHRGHAAWQRSSSVACCRFKQNSLSQGR